MAPNALTVRHVITADYPELRTIRLASLVADPQAFGSTYAREIARDEEWWEGWAARSEEGARERTFALVDEDDAWLGLALVRLDDEKPGVAAINAMWVSPQARGRRGASALCDMCATWAGQHGAEELILGLFVDNRAAQRAYETAGFSITHRATWSRDGETFDVLRMSRVL
jgi:RimJ/RimL family protein N-acetyltransferase